jgi:hypothetical protein
LNGCGTTPRPVTAGLFCFNSKPFQPQGSQRTAKSINKMYRIKTGLVESYDARWFKVLAKKTDRLIDLILIILYILFSRFWFFSVIPVAERF